MGEVIGRGGMAEVFAGTDRRLGRQVAIKLLRPDMAARPDIRTRFEAEARAAASLSHPNAVAVFDTGEYDGVPYIVMERLGGETLGDRMAAGPVDPAWLVTVATEVLGALSAAHTVGLMHRDVKPANILLGADGRAMVADFGIAKSLEAADGGDLTNTGELLGTPAYLAPERLDGSAAGPRSDLWALGVVLYEALAGFKPFSGPTALATARAVMSGTHKPLSEVRPDLEPGLVATVETAMAHDPAKRFASAEDMAAALTTPAADAATIADNVKLAGAGGTQVLDPGLINDPAAVATPTPPPQRAWLRPALTAVVLAGLAILLVVLVVRARSSDRTPTSATPGPTSASLRTTTTASATGGIAQQLRDTAAGLGADDGSMAPTVASRLQAVADQVQAGGGGSEATALLATTVGLARAGQLTSSAAATVAQALVRVPGIDRSVVDALTNNVTPTTADLTPTPGKGKKGKD
ncbi:MAG: serine/threonine protein kinase [Actinomycetota bacterium]|nr:serine/threonine protein kinase [Actinomycetota bacterium]